MGQRGAVLNGRDIGTVVFPNADLKFFLTASAEERAGRRFNEDRVANASISFEQTMTEMVDRDRRDSTRADSPLKAADDAIVIDSSALSIDQVFARMMEHVHRHH
jgi:cytidylate kinase